MADVKKITFKGDIDVKDVIQGIDQIKSELGKLALGPGLQSEFDKLFQRIEKNSEKANEAMASGFKNKGDVKRYTDAMDQIVNAYDNIITKAKILSNSKKIHLEADTSNLKTVRAELESLKTASDEARKAAVQAGKDLGTALKDAARNHKNSTAASWNAAVESYKKGEIQETENAIKTLENTIKVAQTKSQKNGTILGDEWQEKIKDVKAMREAFDKYVTAQKNVITSEDELKNKQQEENEILNRGAEKFREIATAGEKGAKGVRDFAKESSNAAKGSQQLNSELENFKGKAAYFFGLSNAINLFKRAVRSAYDTVKDLDAVMTETAVVTNFSVGDMWSQLPEYTQRANQLGVTIHDTYEAATLFYQQGLKTNEVMQISNETLKMARIAGLDAATASDRMTNALRGFNMELDKTSAQRVNDVYSKLAAITASNTDEISTAMTKVASLAHNANMEFETTAAFLAQIIESTRESAETAGTALKTVVARFSEVKKLYSKGELMGQDEEGEEIDVNKVSTALRSAGINLNEYLTGAKGLDDIFIELADKWDSLDQVQQRYIATMAAGSRQQSRFIALMSNSARTTELVEAANNANGASQEQYEKTLDSLQTKLARLKNAWNEFILGLTNSDVIKGAVDLLTSLITAINNLIKLVSGKNAGVKMITTFFTAFTAFKVGSKVFGGKNNIVGNIFTQLTDLGVKKAGQSAQVITKYYESSLRGEFGKTLKQDLGKGIGNSGLFNYFLPKKTEFKVHNIDNFREKLFGNEAITTAAKHNRSLNAAIDAGNIEEVNKALKEEGVQLQINKENAEQFGVTCRDVSKRSVNSWALIGAAATAAGAAIMAVGDWVKGLGKEFETAGTIIKALGTGLLVFGTIMSVTLPMMAKAGAAGITAAIDSIPIIGWIAAIISAIIALGAAIYGLYQNDKYENKLKAASDASKKAADAADEAAKAYENLGKSWDDLQDKYAAIDKATAGTQKWKDAIKEANDEAMQLVATYEGLDTKIDENGRLIVTESSKNAVQEKLRDAKDMAQAAALGAQINVNRVKRNEVESNFRNYHDITGMRGESPQWKGRDGETYTDATLTEKLIDLYKKGKIKSLDDLRMRASDYYSDYELKDVWGYTSKITEDDFKALQEYVKAPELEEASKAQMNAFISNALGKISDKDAIKLGKNLISTDFANQIVNKELDDVKKERVPDKREEYAKNLGYKDYASWKVQANNNEDIKDEDLNTQLAAQRTQKKLNSFATQFEGKMGNLTETQLKFLQEESGGALTKNEIDNLQGQGKAIYEALGGKEFFDAIGISEEQFVKKFDTDLGWASKNAEIEIKGLSENLVGDLTAGARKSLSENFESIFTASGKEGVEEITEQINTLTENMKPEQQKNFIKALTQVDWASANSVHTLSELAEEYGIAEDGIKDLENSIIELNNAATKVDLKKVSEQLKSLFGLEKKIVSGEQGRSFTEEQKNNLVAAGVDESKFQYNIETGNYDYIGDKIQDVVDAINNQTDKMLDVKQLEKDVASGAAATEVLKNSGSKDEAKVIQEYIDKAGKENSKISQDKLDAAKNKARDTGNYTDLYNLIEIIKKEKEGYEDNQVLLDTANSREVMKRQLNAGFINAADANLGDEEALKALRSQLSSSGLPEELKQKLLTGMTQGYAQDWEVYGKKANTTMAGNIVDTFNQAKANGISTEDLNAYAEALKRVEGLQDAETDRLYALALAEGKYNVGMKSLVSSYGDWSKLIDKKKGNFKIPEPDTDAFKVYSKMKSDVEKMLNSSQKIPDKFFEAEGNAKLLEKAVKQDKKAVAELSTKLAKLNIGDLGDTDLNNQVNDYLKKIQDDIPNFKIGADFDEDSAELKLAKLLAQSGKTVDEINKIMSNLGVSLEWEEKEMSYADASKGNTTGYREIVKEDGSKEKVPINGETESDNETKVKVPMPKKATAIKRPKLNPPTTKKKKKGGGGSKKSKKKAEYWDNPYDELYNLQEKINESLRKREALERRYQKLLKQEKAELSDIRKSYYDQIGQLRYEANLQKELEAGRLRQINNLGNQTYTTSAGKKTTFAKMGVTGYAHYDQEKNTMVIDWEGLNKLAQSTKGTEKGKAVEAYISKLEELSQSYEQVRDDLFAIEDKIEELRQAAIESLTSFEDRVMEAVVNKYQKEIDSYQAMSDAIDKVNNEVINSLREQIDLSRQIRDNTKKEEDISKKENRLAYLQRDTSGANALEILKLQKELEDDREGYTDTLVDQAIDKMQKDADGASEQRQRQIDIMTEQLKIAQETGELWNEVYDLMNKASESEIFSEDSELAKILKDGEAFKSLSNLGQLEWWKQVGEAFHQAIIGRGEAEDKYQKDVNNDETVENTGTSKTLKEVTDSNTQANVEADKLTEHTDAENYGVAAAIVMGGKDFGGWDSGTKRVAKLKEKGFDPDQVTPYITQLYNAKKEWDAVEAAKQKEKGKYKKGKKKGKWKYTKKAWTGWKNSELGVTDWNKYKFSQFRTGGLADSTGPAWLDGTKSKPELVLNAQDTKNFIALKDILASLLNLQGAGGTVSKGGDNYFDINISADIGSDYDVDRLASRIKKQIYEDGQYRNVNTINFLR